MEKQKKFFKAVDNFQKEDAVVWGDKRRKETELDTTIRQAMSKLPVRYRHTQTVVVEAAFGLLQQGVLNIPDVGIVNVKQARAFLWNAVWLQEHMIEEWREDGTLEDDPGRPRKFQEFSIAIFGPGGTGKTAVLKLVEALVVFFMGPETVQKLAPSNAAARLLGGDTLHALCKLPFGSACLTEKKGRLTKPVLQCLRRKWRRTIAVSWTESRWCPRISS